MQPVVIVPDDARVLRAADIAERLNRGETMRQIADDIGTSASTICRAMATAGYRRGPNWQAS